MGRLTLVARLAGRDIRRGPAEALLLTAVIAAAAAVLTLGLVLTGVSANPFRVTRAATAGPDVVAIEGANGPAGSAIPADYAALTDLARAPGVTRHGGPYPFALPVLSVGGHTDLVIAIGRRTAPARLDQPHVTAGRWVSPGGVVVERSFATSLGIEVGHQISFGHRHFTVVGIAVTAAIPAYPFSGQFDSTASYFNPGVMWLTEADARSLATPSRPLYYTEDLALTHPSGANAFVDARSNQSAYAPNLLSWQEIDRADGLLSRNEERVFQLGSSFLCLLAIASIAVLVGGRLADQTRRVGLLKVVGAGPGLVAGVLLSEYAAIALAAGGLGVGVGWLGAPLLANPGAGLVGSAGSATVTASTILIVLAVALAVALLASVVPSVRSGRTSPIRALVGSVRPPQRRASVLAVSAHLPVPLLLGLRLAARRVRRSVLAFLSVALTTTTLVTVLADHLNQARVSDGLPSPRATVINEVLLVVTVALIALAGINAIFVSWTTALDARRPLAVARAIGVSPGQIAAGLSAAQLFSALPGAMLGIPLGLGLFSALRGGGTATFPPPGLLIVLLLAVSATMAGLAVLPGLPAVRRPVAEILAAE